MTDTSERVRRLWEAKASTYDRSPVHNPTSELELSAWRAAALSLLPPPPARVLDVGAGTGFLTILLARQGYTVTALDTSTQMLARLNDKAAAAGVTVQIVEADASDPPKNDYDAVVERHLLWTLPDPAAALTAWRGAAPTGRLVLFASEWGTANGVMAAARSRARALVRDLRQQGCPGDTEYGASLQSQLPLAHGTPPAALVSLVGESSWGRPAIVRLRDIDWAARQTLHPLIDRLLGVSRSFAVTAGA